MRKFFVAAALSLLALPAFAYGPMIVVDGFTTAVENIDDSSEALVSHLGAPIVLEDRADGITVIFDDPKNGLLMVMVGDHLEPETIQGLTFEE